jgi:hypothetical protein
VSENGEPFKFTTKAILVPHLHLLVCATGAHGMLSQWFVQVNDWMVVKDVDHLDDHTPHNLALLWRKYHEEIAVPENATVTLYHFGLSEADKVIHGYTYRSTEQFRSQPLPYGLGVKPECPIPPAYDLPRDIKPMMDAQRSIQEVLPAQERIYIGGEIQLYHLTMESCNFYTLGRFEDYPLHEHAIYANFTQGKPLGP